jgi:hypothetical protein
LDPSSLSYTQIVGTVAMPNVGDELHHFGWNACDLKNRCRGSQSATRG